MRRWTSRRCTLALCLAEAPLAPYSLFASCRRSTSQLTNYVTLPFADPQKALDHVSRKVLCHGVAEWAVRVTQVMYSNAQSRMQVNIQYNYEFGMGIMCIRTLPLAHCSSSRWWRHFHMSSALVYRGSFSSLATCCSSQTPRRSVSPCSRHGRQVWKVKSSISTWRRPSRPSSWFLVLAVLPVLGLSATTQSSAHSASGGSTRSAVASLSKQLVAASNYVCRRCKGEARRINGRSVDVGGTMLDVEATFCYLCDILCSGGIAASFCGTWGKFRKHLSVLTTRYLSPRICGKVYEACVCPNN